MDPLDHPTANTRRKPGKPADVVPPHGPHQAGIATRPQQHLLLTAYDVQADAAHTLQRLLPTWTELLTKAAYGTSSAPELTGTAPAKLTATLSVGSALIHRLGIPLPPGLTETELPPFDRDMLDPHFCGGDLLVQLCADDLHVLHQTSAALTRLAGPSVRPRWRQTGFHQAVRGTPRNLLAFKDGTENPPADRIWLEEGPFTGGTCLVVRRIALDVPAFTSFPRQRQEETIGRSLESGAPLGGRLETDTADLSLTGPDGKHVVPQSAHLRVCHPSQDDGERMLRRGYSYASHLGDEGLLFIAFMRDIRLFIRMQHRMDAQDAITDFTRTRGSATFLTLPGAKEGEPLGYTPLGL